jgi:uncharacterized protein YjbJ (UPF0337 family)
MDQERIKGAARDVGGKVQEGFGRATGDVRMQAEGMANELKGRAQDLYGQARERAADVAVDMADAAREAGSSSERILRKTIEQQPYTAVAIALGLAWLLGRSHRPV